MQVPEHLFGIISVLSKFGHTNAQTSVVVVVVLCDCCSSWLSKVIGMPVTIGTKAPF